MLRFPREESFSGQDLRMTYPRYDVTLEIATQIYMQIVELGR